MYLQIRHRMRVSKYGIKMKSHHHLRECLPMMYSESQRLHITICAPPLTLYAGSICPFFSCPPICVCIILHLYTHAHTRMMTPTTHKMSVSVYAYQHTDQKTRTQSKERETKRHREEVCGVRSLEIDSGWWGGPHLQVLEACLPRSLHTCLDTSNNA